MLLAFADERALALKLAAELRCELAMVVEHRFPDGEIKLTLPPSLPGRTRTTTSSRKLYQNTSSVASTRPALLSRAMSWKPRVRMACSAAFSAATGAAPVTSGLRSG